MYMFNTNLQSMRQIGEKTLHVLEAFYEQVAVGSIDGPLWAFAYNFQKLQ